MKNYVAVLIGALGISSAHADIFATKPNDAGGEIVLLTQQGSCPTDERQMFTRASTGQMISGCWFWNKPYIFVTYRDGSQRVYSSDGWNINDKFKQKGNPL